MARADVNIFNSNWDVFPDGKHFVYIDTSDNNETVRRLVLIQNWPEYARRIGANQ